MGDSTTRTQEMPIQAIFAPTDQKPGILVQLDTDPLASTFDRIVAIDSGVEHLFSYSGITPDAVMPLVHGCIFTRGPRELNRTAIFVGGTDINAGEALVAEIRKHMIPAAGLTVSVMLDSNGANTTAAAAVRAAGRHVNLNSTESLVLGGTGPVGMRVARLLARHGGHVRIGSRQLERAQAVCEQIRTQVPGAKLEAVMVGSSSSGPLALADRELVIAAGAPGAMMLPKKIRQSSKSLRVLIDLNGVPPAGIEGVELTDKGVNRENIICYGALGVGSTKMKIHRAAIKELFTRNNLLLDIDEIYQIALREQ